MVTQLLARLAAQSDNALPRLSDEAMRALVNYDYPGNVRELENILERALALCDGEKISAADLHITEDAGSSSTGAINASGERTLPLHEYLDQLERQQILKALEQTKYNKTAAAKVLGVSFRSLRYRLDRLGID
jgi:two-component system response regulator PilR (NtrC family)